LVVAASLTQEVRAQDSAERVTVTGTRIRAVGAVSASPITTLSAEEMQSSQPVAVEEFFKGLPAAIPAIGPGTNNGTSGGATIDIRGLGSNRSLVLLDGRRIVPFDLSGSVDTNVIPIALLSRVEMVTGGASAVYGADAVAGVANFILKKDFRGFAIDSTYGLSEKGDAIKRRTDFTMGAGLDNGRGNVALSFGMTKTDPLRQDPRDIGVRAISSTSGNPQGSQTSVPLIEGNLGQQVDPVAGAFIDTLRTYNFNPDNYFQTPMNRTQVTALGNYTINDKAEVYTQLLFTRADVGSQLAPSGTFFNDYNVPLGNPFLTPTMRQQICTGYALTAVQCANNNTEVLMSLGRRFVELGPRLNDFKNTAYQTTLGVKGDLMAGLSYDAYASRGKSDQVQTRGHWGSFSKVQQALRAVSATDCIDPANGCVPLNVFGAAGTITPAMLNFINLDAVLGQTVEQTVYSGSISGDMGSFKSPLAKQPISFALGAEYRELAASNHSDASSQIQGEVLGTGAPTPDHAGSFNLKEAFFEAQVPLAADLPAIYRASLDLGYRESTFKTTSSTSYGTYKFGGDWAPIKGLRFRAMKQRATRAPNIDELYLPQLTALDNLAVDPCAGNAINVGAAGTAGTLSNLCQLTGVPLARIGTLAQPSAGQINTLQGGNPDLKPEVADTLTLGLVWEPDYIKGLTFTADYYKITINGAVSNPSSTDVLDDCYNAQFNPTFANNAACNLIKRNPNTGSFNGTASPGVILLTSNLGKIVTAGYDIGVTYTLPLHQLGLSPSAGRLSLGLQATILDTYDYQATPRSVNRNCVGFYSVACGGSGALSDGQGPINRTKWSQCTNWTVGDFTVGYNWRHLSGVQEEPGGPSFLAAFSTIKAYDYLDLSATWNFNKMLRLSVAVNNLTDKKPPLVGNTIGSTTANSGNTFPQTYDTIGRFYSLGLGLKF
jgi:outer membrane receptor protein involved in Fe transport